MPFVEAVDEFEPMSATFVAKLEHIQLDALREIANIGAGHAATALSAMTARAVTIGVPSVTLASRTALVDIVGRDVPIILTRIRADGAFDGGLVVALSEPAAQTLTDLLIGRTTDGHGWFDGIASSALMEIGNVLGAAYLNALASLTGWTIPISTPRLIYARAGWAVQLMCNDRSRDRIALCLDTCFTVEGAADPVRGHVILYPKSETVQQLLRVLEIQ